MDLSKVFIIGADYKDPKKGPQWDYRLFAEVVLIDKTHPSLKPLLYQLKDTILPLEQQLPFLKQGFLGPRDAFVHLGDVATIDKKNKQILLNNQTCVSYNYLIVASGSKSNFHNPDHEAEFCNGLQALVDAMRVRKKIGQSFGPSLTGDEKLTPSKLSRFFCSSKNIEKIVVPCLSCEDNNAITFDLGSINKRLFEVQV